MLLSGIMVTALAWGQGVNDFSVASQVLLSPSNLVWGQRQTVGSPSVVLHEPYDRTSTDIMLMAYETQIGGPTANCPAGTWGVGLAFKTGGGDTAALTDAGPIIQPAAGSYYGCVAAHPTIVQLSNGSSSLTQAWLVYFKAEQECAPGDAGCDRYTGLGKLVIRYQGSSVSGGRRTYSYTLEGPDVSPVLTDVAQDMGYPKAAFVGGQYRIAFSQNPDIYLASSPFVDGFTAPTTPVLTAGTPGTWGEDELFTPSILCTGSSALKMFPGGRSWDVSPSILTDVSVGLFESSDFSTFTETNAGPFLSTLDGDPEVRHLHVASSGNYAEYAFYFSSPNGSGGNEIRFAETSNYTWRTTDSRRCP